MKVLHIFGIIALVYFTLYSSSSEACRHVLPGAGSKSNEANFSYFDHVVVIEAIEIGHSHLVSMPDRNPREYARLRVIKSYKGNLPREFVILNNSSDTCGYSFIEGEMFLAFFDARSSALKIAEYPELPFLTTGLYNTSTSQMIRVSDQSVADKIIADAKQR
ncbi:hypothetical protein [Methylobacterium indicum]|uniref:hypothetical protein n=1 Tax=Methylobacterium indicum TaxID=1775910 RepID=UPI001A910A8B|nr:hypothetical protein [Methylobacterium indicum]